MRNAILAVALLLAGCATAGHSSSADVAALTVGLTAAERAATAYLTLPTCPGAPLCSNPGISARIKAADQKAYVAVKAAGALAADVQAAPNAVAASLAAARTALVALQQLVPQQVHP